MSRIFSRGTVTVGSIRTGYLRSESDNHSLLAVTVTS